ncbi:tetratricopeptide repeat-containing sulfotransferase family protein [Frigidibacter oleivorans]|uniref:tetratricopeptide repeat-containing sulfotransferase family protein n=1 Tax=Frigidibacter oleivorans TaxID=2487129 RepID=UPI000F8E8EEA|nr:tetratricopeptide repeat-containing sulfotransferase family protein [Frigidibacter oleivorans]
MVTDSKIDLEALYAEAMRLQAAGRLEEALQRYERMLAAKPGIPEVHFQVGRIFLTADKIDRALPHLQAATRLRPGEPAVWLARAQAVALAADPQAETAFLSELKTAPVPADLRLRLQDRFGAALRRPAGLPPALQVEGRKLLALMAAGRFAEADLAGTALLARHPNLAPVLNLVATARAKQGKVEAATEAYLRAARAAGDDPEPFENLGQMYLLQRRFAEAKEAFKQAVALGPRRASALALLAAACLQQRDLPRATRLAEAAIRLDPRDAAPHVTLANVRIRQKDFAGAEGALRAALAADPDRADALALLGQCCSRLGRDDEAMAFYRRALDLRPDLPLAVSGLATLYQTLGDFEAAEPLFRRSFELSPNAGETWRNFLASHRVTEGDPILGQMQARFDNPMLGDEDRIGFGFAIAKALEDLKQYDRVFPYLKTANDLSRRLYPYDIAQRQARVADVMASMASRDWPGTAVGGTEGFAPIFVTGMPRSGTTLVEQIIASHSAVTGTGEVNVAANLATALLSAGTHARALAGIPDAEIAGLGRDYAAALATRAPGAARITDKSIQSYMYIGLLKLALPQARFIVVRRDPRDNLVSIYKNRFAEGTHLYSNSLRDLGLYYRTFHEMIEFWRARVPGWFHEVQYEDLVADPETQTRQLIAACGLDWEDACLNFHQNRRKVDTLSVFQVRQPISTGSLQSWRRYAPHLGELFEALGDLLPGDGDAAE